MRIRNRHLLASTVLAAALVAFVAMAASAASTVKINNCVKALTRPSSVTLTCGDGNTALSALRWSSFGGKTAKASGTLKMNTCTPNCADGKFVSYPVQVTASEPRSCKGGVKVYNKLNLRFTGRTPSVAGNFKSWTLGCPV